MEWQTGRTVNKCEKREHHEPSGLSATHLLGRFLLSATLTIESLLRGLNVDVGRRLPADMGMDGLLGLHLADGRCHDVALTGQIGPTCVCNPAWLFAGTGMMTSPRSSHNGDVSGGLQKGSGSVGGGANRDRGSFPEGVLPRLSVLLVGAVMASS